MPFVINVTLPDEVPNYIHRIGRVGRADRMGLAISLVATVQEKVWYHTCGSRGQNCHNTKLVDQKGCCIWYNEQQLLGDIEEHLGVTISQVDKNMNVPVDEFEGHVVYGEKRKQTGKFPFRESWLIDISADRELKTSSSTHLHTVYRVFLERSTCADA